MKITEKISFNVASEASYVYILSGQKLIQNAKNGDFSKTLSLLSNSVTRQFTIKRTKIGGKCQKWSIWRVFKNLKFEFNSRRNGEKSQNLKKSKCDILGDFQTL